MYFEKIKKVADEKGVSIYKLEKEAGFSSGCITKWKTSIPSVEKLKIIAKILDVTVDELIS